MRLRACSMGWSLVALLALAGWGWPEPADPAVVEGACTSFCLDNGGHAVFGTNYDNMIREGLLFVNQRGVTKSGWEPGTSGKFARWTAEYGSVTFTLAGVQMAWAGMNEAGLAISTMWLRDTRNPAPDGRPPLVAPLWIQYQLDTCATLGEVMANDARVRVAPGTSDHYLVCDRTGDCAAVEFLEGKTIFHSGDALPVRTLTNHAYQKAVGAWQARRLTSNSLVRFGIAADRVTDFETTGVGSAVDYAFVTLDQASGQATGGAPTQWSIVFDSENLRVHWRTSLNSQVRSVDLTRLDFACGTPVQMLDVHAPLSGDISDRLGRYSFEANLQRTIAFLEKWQSSDLSPFEVEVLERGLASFRCERPAPPYQEEAELLVPPLAGWIVLALAHRLWPAAVAVMLGVGALIAWRLRARGRRAHDSTHQQSLT